MTIRKPSVIEEKPACSNCRFGHMKQSEPVCFVDPSTFWVCRKSPPVNVENHGFLWPNIEGSDWCGQYDPSDKKS